MSKEQERATAIREIRALLQERKRQAILDRIVALRLRYCL